MNKNIDKALEKIFNDSELIERLLTKKTPDEFYEFCVSVHGGYTKDELDIYVDEVMDTFQPEDFGLELGEEDLENVSGGVTKKVYSRLIASALAPLMLMPLGSPSARVMAAEATAHKPRVSAKLKEPQKSFWQRHKGKIIAAGLFVLTVASFFTYRYYKGASQADLQYHVQPQLSLKEQLEQRRQTAESQYNTAVAELNTYLGNLDGATGKVNVLNKHKATIEAWQDVLERTNKQIAALDSGKSFFKALGNWFDKIPFLGKAVGAAGALAAVGGYGLDKLSNISKKFRRIVNLLVDVSALNRMFSGWSKYLLDAESKAPVELHQSIDNLDYLFEEVKGQEKAKKEVKSIVFNILHRKKHAELSGREYGKGDVLYFYGPSRVGKTMMARGLAKYKILSNNTEPYYISASEVDKDSKKETVLDQLFGTNKYYGGFGGFGGFGMNDTRPSAILEPKDLVKYISDNPNGIVIIDEYDKMWSSGLDEVFRTIVDNGEVHVKGQTINCSGITFILTSNECEASVLGGNQDDGSVVDDGTGSRTYIRHDKSFLNRIRPVPFENLSVDAYEDIIKQEFKDDLVDYWIREEIAGLSVVISDTAIKNMAKSVEKKNRGASYVSDLESDLFRDISLRIYSAECVEKDYYRGKTMFVDFDPATDTFILKDDFDGGHNLSEEEYKTIIRSEFTKNIVDNWDTPERGNISIIIDEKTINDIAAAAMRKNQGIGYVTIDLQSALMDAIVQRVEQAVSTQKDYYKDKKIIVAFNADKDEFVLTDSAVDSGDDKKAKDEESDEAKSVVNNQGDAESNASGALDNKDNTDDIQDKKADKDIKKESPNSDDTKADFSPTSGDKELNPSHDQEKINIKKEENTDKPSDSKHADSKIKKDAPPKKPVVKKGKSK